MVPMESNLVLWNLGKEDVNMEQCTPLPAHSLNSNLGVPA